MSTFVRMLEPSITPNGYRDTGVLLDTIYGGHNKPRLYKVRIRSVDGQHTVALYFAPREVEVIE